VAEAGVYVAPAFRGRGVGREAAEALSAAAEAAGFWKLVSRRKGEGYSAPVILRSYASRTENSSSAAYCLS
jgi:L-amino acid N-acyltransferase YncA